MSRRLAVDSRKARQEFTQCQNCYKGKDSPKVKLSLCTGCRISTYCSSECQRAHWPVHKPLCLARRRTHQTFEEMDIQAIADKPSLEKDPAEPLPSQLATELRSFNQKFNPALFQAAFNCLELHKDSNCWKEFVVLVDLDRIRDPAPDSRPWSRFKVAFVGPLPAQYVSQTMGGSTQDFERVKKAQEEQHKGAGNIGTITIILHARCTSTDPPRSINNVTFIGFGTHSRAILDIKPGWLDDFKMTVEKMSGRGPSTPNA